MLSLWGLFPAVLWPDTCLLWRHGGTSGFLFATALHACCPGLELLSHVSDSSGAYCRRDISAAVNPLPLQGPRSPRQARDD